MPTKLGQNFLKDKSVVDKIIQAAALTASDFVVEIGPGEGVLTEELAKHAGKVLAIEIDKNLLPALKNKFSAQGGSASGGKNAKNVSIINEDILKIDFKKIVTDYELLVTGYKLIANIPYYITSPIIRLFLEAENQPQEMILMVQKEVAERIVAGPGQMSILAVSVQYYAQAELLFPVSKIAFDPVPEVDSAVIKILPRKKYHSDDDRKFFRIVRAGFSAKRKTLVNNLANALHSDKNIVAEKIKALGLGPNVRAQELSVEDWKKLATQLSLLDT